MEHRREARTKSETEFHLSATGRVSQQNKKEEHAMRLAVIADDLTGALDTGVKFAGGRRVVRVRTNIGPPPRPEEQTDVLVIDAELRHKTPEQAYRECFKTVRQVL